MRPNARLCRACVAYDAVTPNSVSGLREYVAVGNYRGNVTTTVVPGQTINTTYDASGAVVARNDAQSHTVSLAAGIRLYTPSWEAKKMEILGEPLHMPTQSKRSAV